MQNILLFTCIESRKVFNADFMKIYLKKEGEIKKKYIYIYYGFYNFI